MSGYKKIELSTGEVVEFPDSMSDDDIANVLRQQYPVQNAQKPAQAAPAQSWGDVPMAAVKNAPQSAANFAGDIWNAVTSPVETIKSVGDLGAGAIRVGVGKVSPNLMDYIDSFSDKETTQRLDQTAAGASQMIKDRYGSEDAWKKTLSTDPVGALGDLSTLLTGGSAVASKVPALSKAAEYGSKAAKYTDPISLVAKGAAAASPLVTRPLAAFTGTTTGAGTEAVRTAYETGKQGGSAGQEFRQTMRGHDDGSGLVAEARHGVDSMHADMTDAYRANRAQWSKPVANVQMSVGPIDAAYANLVSDFTKGGFNKLGKKDSKILREIGTTIDEWKKANPVPDIEAFDDLKQAVGNINYDRMKHTKASAMIGRLTSTAKKEIVKVSPEYAAAMSDYERRINQIKDIQKTLSLGDKAMTDTALRKLLSATRNNVNTNFGQRKKLLTELEEAGDVNLTPGLAGLSLNTPLPRGIQGALAAPTAAFMSSLAHPFAAAGGLFYGSPRAVGETAHALGRVAGQGESLGNMATKRLTPLQSISDLYQEDEALAELKRRRKNR